MRGLGSLNSAELLVALVEDLDMHTQYPVSRLDIKRTYSINALQKGVTQNVKGHGTSRLDPSIDHSIACHLN